MPNNANLRGYAHCAADGSGDITLVLANLDSHNSLQVDVSLTGAGAVSGRTEYHGTGPEGMLSLELALNGKPLELNQDGTLPDIEGQTSSGTGPLSLAPASWAFVQLHGAKAKAC